ncbi:28S ribosomal protein S36 [Tropilaelaps mercedesae]|uniref:28S ribosomal protein S36 n=1 Tax=Tropilaelaps mercedesae TaxID=418985 RepID=A0A1V9X5K2_9ACAR|nr:28S ribosomal protein S36 [Tropilaelaps mercedesae]
MSGIANNVLKALKPHIPLIKFRKGGKPNEAALLSSGGATPGVSSSAGSSARGSGIEEDLMPKRYARLPLGEHEAELIMSGGAC